MRKMTRADAFRERRRDAGVAVMGLACFLVTVVGALWLLKWLLWG